MEQLKTRNNKEVKVGKRTHQEAETFWQEVTGITTLDTHHGSGRGERSPSSQEEPEIQKYHLRSSSQTRACR